MITLAALVCGIPGCCGENLLRGAITLEEGVHFLQGNPTISSIRIDRFLSLLDGSALCVDSADKVPDRIFYIGPVGTDLSRVIRQTTSLPLLTNFARTFSFVRALIS